MLSYTYTTENSCFTLPPLDQMQATPMILPLFQPDSSLLVSTNDFFNFSLVDFYSKYSKRLTV